jgi:hypothetical protein
MLFRIILFLFFIYFLRRALQFYRVVMELQSREAERQAEKNSGPRKVKEEALEADFTVVPPRDP